MGQPPVPPAAQPHQPQQVIKGPGRRAGDRGGRGLIGQRVDAAIHAQLAAIQAQLADVQALSADHQHARAGTQHDALVVEALYVLHAGDGELLPSLQL